MNINYSQDIIQFISKLVDKLRTQWDILEIDITSPDLPIVSYKELVNYNIAEEEEIELGYWHFITGKGYEWVVVLSGIAYDVTSLGTFRINNPSLVDLTQVTEIRNKKPYFYHGTYIDVNKELDTNEHVFSNALYPAVIVWEVIRQPFDSDHLQIVGNTPRLTMSFLDTTNKLDWTNDQQYSEVVYPMERYADKFIKICDNHPYIAKLKDWTYIKHTNWGKVVQSKGHVKYLLDENLAGLNLEIDLPIKKSCLNKHAKI